MNVDNFPSAQYALPLDGDGWMDGWMENHYRQLLMEHTCARAREAVGKPTNHWTNCIVQLALAPFIASLHNMGIDISMSECYIPLSTYGICEMLTVRTLIDNRDWVCTAGKDTCHAYIKEKHH